MRYLFILCLFVCIQATAQQKTAVVYFEFAGVEFTQASTKDFPAMLKDIVAQSPTEVTVYGYTDQIGMDTSNTSLGMMRARKVATMLLELLPKTKIIMKSLGENKPATTNAAELALNRRAEIIYPLKKTTSATVLEPVKIDAEEQRFTISLNDTAAVTAKEGTGMRIEPGALETKDKITASGSAVIIIKEYYNPGTMMLAGMHTVSPKGPLQSGGMVSVIVMQGNDTLQIKKGRSANIKMPVIGNGFDNMSVFNMPQINDSAHWQSAGNPFNFFNSLWVSEDVPELDDFNYPSDIQLSNMRIGARYNDSYTLFAPFLRSRKLVNPYTRSISYETYKINADTVLIHATLKHRNRGRRKFGRRNFDTTIVLRFKKPIYEGITTSLGLINCDRFLNMAPGPEMFVSTPGYKGMNVFAYFKSSRALLPGYETASDYRLGRIPKNLPVEFIATGRTGDKYYFGKVAPTAGNVKSIIVPQELSFTEFKKQMANL